MKKFLMMAMMAAAATTAFAQDALVKEAKKLYAAGELDQAAAKLTPALTAAETKDKAEAWNLMNEIKYKVYQNEYQNRILQKPYDTDRMVNALVEAFKAAEECEKYDVLPNEKGKVKIRFRKANATRYLPERQWLYIGGVLQYQAQNTPGAIKAWGAYIESAKSPIFVETTMPADTLLADAAYNTALLAYEDKDYATAKKYVDVATQFPEKVEDAINIKLFILKETATTHADSVAYLSELKKQHTAKPDNEQYFNLLQEYYTRANDAAAMKAWAKEETGLDAQNKMAWALLGEAEMNSENWQEAIDAFKKAVELDPNWTTCVFNIAVCLQAKARALQDQLTDKNGNITKANFEKVKAILKEALVFCEKAKELEPYHETTKWHILLQTIYDILGYEDISNNSISHTNSLERRADNSFQVDASGTGFLIDKRGYLATNNHVTEGAKGIYVCLQNNGVWKSYYAIVIKSDPINDLSIIRIEDEEFKSFASLPYNFSTEIAEVASDIYTLGYPQVQIMGTEVKYSSGSINSKSGVQGDPTHYQISAHIDHGNSGGPMFNSQGTIIGITDGGLDKAEFGDVNYAIKSSYLKSLVDALPIKLELPHDTSIAKLSRVEQIKTLSKYTALILIDFP